MALERVSGGDRIRELKEKRKRQARLRFFIGLIAVLVILVGGVFAFRIKQFQIRTIVVRGNYIVASEDVERIMNTMLDQSYAWVIPKRSILLYPENALRAEIAKQFPRFETIKFHRENITTLVVDVTERKNVYLWCDRLPNAGGVQNQNCYYVDDRGYIFSRSPSFSGNIYFVFYGNYTWAEQESPVGKRLFEAEYFKQLIRFKEGITGKGLVSYGFIKYSTGVSSFLLAPSLDDTKQKIVFLETQDIPTLYENLALALTSGDLQNQLKDNFAALQYLDLRYDKKVYYKFGSAPDVTEQETAPVAE